MIIWIDAHLSPAIAVWITSIFGITSNAQLQNILRSTLLDSLELLRSGEVLVEIRGC
ncbi:MAG: hypothetical protein NT070_21115 [Cyanobacteria bacterium]|nr:hypothetical protein [Cyanobacteriota bacterium]